MNLISIIIPTTRPENESLESFFNFAVPYDYDLEYIFVIDNPSKSLENLTRIVKKYQQYRIKILKNERNLGASVSRNKGINNAKGDFILSIDDDCEAPPNLLIEFIKAYEEDPDCPGYIGLTNSPKPETSFEKAVCLSDMLHFFKIASHKKKVHWGITANLFIKRESAGNVRFSSIYPKKGGGEDIAFCLEILENFNNKKTKNNNADNELKLFKCVPKAEIIHPFWQESFKSYLRFFRWGYGDVVLHKNFPKYRFHQYPNLIELVFLYLLGNLLLFILLPIFNITLDYWLLFFNILLSILLICLWELRCEAKKLQSQERKYQLIPLIKAVLIRQLNDLGRFIHQLPKIWKITSRWDYFCTGESLEYEKKNARIKFIGFISIIFLIITITFIIKTIFM